MKMNSRDYSKSPVYPNYTKYTHTNTQCICVVEQMDGCKVTEHHNSNHIMCLHSVSGKVKCNKINKMSTHVSIGLKLACFKGNRQYVFSSLRDLQVCSEIYRCTYFTRFIFDKHVKWDWSENKYNRNCIQFSSCASWLSCSVCFPFSVIGFSFPWHQCLKGKNAHKIKILLPTTWHFLPVRYLSMNFGLNRSWILILLCVFPCAVLPFLIKKSPICFNNITRLFDCGPQSVSFNIIILALILSLSTCH